MPSLRERPDDIRVPVEYFIDRFGRKTGKKFRNISEKTIKLFETYPWPGNIRELQNVIERAVQPGVVATRLNWSKLMPDGIGINVLTSERLTDIGGGATFYSCLVEVEKVGD